jgi:hypothetical protein
MFGYLVAGGVGVLSVGFVWFGYLTVTKSGAWALAKLKAWWTKGKADLATLKSDLAAVESRVTSLEHKAATPAAAPAPAA